MGLGSGFTHCAGHFIAPSVCWYIYPWRCEHFHELFLWFLSLPFFCVFLFVFFFIEILFAYYTWTRFLTLIFSSIFYLCLFAPLFAPLSSTSSSTHSVEVFTSAIVFNFQELPFFLLVLFFCICSILFSFSEGTISLKALRTFCFFVWNFLLFCSLSYVLEAFLSCLEILGCFSYKQLESKKLVGSSECVNLDFRTEWWGWPVWSYLWCQ